MSALTKERVSSSDVCAFEDYESLESGLSREFISSELLSPQSSRQIIPTKKLSSKDDPSWQLCRLTRPLKEEFRLCGEHSGRFMFAAKKVGDTFYISTYEEESNNLGMPAADVANSPKANFAAILRPHCAANANGRKRGNGNKTSSSSSTSPISYRLHLSCGIAAEDDDRRNVILEVWPSTVWSPEQQVELRRLQAKMPTPIKETPAHYIHDCASPTRRRPSHPAFFKSHDVQGSIKLVNKLPKWNAQLGCLSLHFGRKRVKASSSKNFLIYTEEKLTGRDSADDAVFQLGKLGSRNFSLDFRYPISPLQAFALALCAFNSKNMPKQNR